MRFTKVEKIVAVTIPIYKADLSHYEELSFRQCLKILGKYDICIFTNSAVCLDAYMNIAKDYGVALKTEHFNAMFFDGVKGYNSLMMNVDFYKRFKTYKYILIYQLDAYVFRDELTYWCNQGYDYVGAPWFENYATHEERANLWGVGNGGFSLRKTSYFIKALSWKLPVKKRSLRQIFYPFALGKLLYVVGRYNNMRYFLRTNTMNEDAFFSQFLQNSWVSPYLPDINIALQFAFEKSPSYLMKLNKDRLPFGCHAFKRYEYDVFWTKYIS